MDEAKEKASAAVSQLTVNVDLSQLESFKLMLEDIEKTLAAIETRLHRIAEANSPA